MVFRFAAGFGGKLFLRTSAHGTTADLWLPAVQKTVEPQFANEASQAAFYRTRSLNLLVVDDDPLVRMSTAAMLEDLGHSVMEASSGDEALQALRTTTFDLLITDHVMPRMTGAELALKALAIQPAIPILVATGFPDFVPNERLPRLKKPFDQIALARAIQTCVHSPPI